MSMENLGVTPFIDSNCTCTLLTGMFILVKNPQKVTEAKTRDRV